MLATFSSKCTHSNTQVNCGNCRLNSLCLPVSLKAEEMHQLDEIVQRRKPYQKGNTVYSSGEDFRAVYAVRSGSFKAVTVSDSGDEQVTGFFMPGEVFGIDGIAHNHYCNTLTALETSSVCEIPFERLEALSSVLPSLQHHFFKLMSKEITQDQQLLILLGKKSAEERVATFLLSLSVRHRQRGLSAVRFRLPMSRTDIGNYLGLTIETVSRSIGGLQKNGVLTVDNKDIEIIHPERLQSISSQ